MDESDGLLGGVLSAKRGVDTFGDSSERTSNDNLGSLGARLNDLVIVPKDSVGRRLLAGMGWKHGQGKTRVEHL